MGREEELKDDRDRRGKDKEEMKLDGGGKDMEEVGCGKGVLSDDRDGVDKDKKNGGGRDRKKSVWRMRIQRVTNQQSWEKLK